MNDDGAPPPVEEAAGGASTLKVLLSYGLALASIVVIATAIVAVAGRLKYYQMKPAAIQLLRTQPNRAELMWRSLKGSCLEALAAAMKTAAMMKTNQIEIIVQATKPAYDAACMGIAMHWKTLLRRIKTALMLAVGGVAAAFVVGTLPVVHIIALLGVGGAALYLLSFKGDVDRSLVLARAELLPEVERAFADGRYMLQP